MLEISEKYLVIYAGHLAKVARGDVVQKKLINTIGKDSEVFGKMNLEILEFTKLIFSTQSFASHVDEVVSKTELIETLPLLCKRFPWNDIMHSYIVAICKVISEGSYPSCFCKLLNSKELFQVFKDVAVDGIIIKKNRASDKFYLMGYLSPLQSISLILESLEEPIESNTPINN